jgi:hypothetical protein
MGSFRLEGAERALEPRRPEEPDPGNAGGGRAFKTRSSSLRPSGKSFRGAFSCLRFPDLYEGRLKT